MSTKVKTTTTFSPFSRLVASETFNTAASAALLVATPLLAVTQLHASPLEVGILAAAGTAAPLLFGLSAGAIADRFDRARLLLGCGVVRLLLAAIIPILLLIDRVSIPALCIVGFAVSAVKLLFDSVTVAVIPTIVQRDQLTKANSWFEAWNSSAASLGPALAGGLMQISSITTVYVSNFFLYVASTFCLRGVVIPDRSSEGPTDSSHLRDIVAGIKLLWQNEMQRTIAIAAGFFNLFHAAFFTVFAVFALKELNFSAATFGSVVSLVGLIGLAGALGAPALVARFGVRTALVGSLLAVGPIGIPIVFAENLGSLQRIGIVAACLALWDFLIVVHIIVEQTIRQMTIESGQLSRITATTRFISWGADPIGALLGGLAASSFIGIRGTMIVCLTGFTAAGLFLLTSRAVRNLSTFDALSDLNARTNCDAPLP